MKIGPNVPSMAPANLRDNYYHHGSCNVNDWALKVSTEHSVKISKGFEQ